MKILVFSKDGDQSTNLVMDWMNHYGHQIIRINNYVDFFNYIPSLQIEHTKKLKLSTDMYGIWIRRRGLIAIPEIEELKENIDQIKNHLKDELLVLFQFTLSKLCEESSKQTGSPKGSRLNKLEVLDIANSVGLVTPITFITNNKKSVSAFLNHRNNIITKSISETTMFINKKGERHAMYTSNFTEEMNASHSELFFPSLFQESIQKSYEIRTYYHHGICYSMAIFSQQSELSSTDFRMYDTVHRVRNVPYKLPKDISNKITKLMRKLNLNEGSIDFIMSTNNEIIFLEVNPAGQFGMVSKPCNYYLEEKIAAYYNE